MTAEPGPEPFPDMVWVPGGRFRMGSDQHYPEERPAHPVTVDGFWMDRHPVTNARFTRFAGATGFRTFAELPPNPADYPSAPPEMLYAGSLVFEQPAGPVDLTDVSQWWRYVQGAQWRAPYGQGSSIDALSEHPVVHVTFSDAVAFAAWDGKVLPTEAEWEFAARGGLGSHLCAPNYCQRYRPAARYPEPVDTSTSHVGFRCIVRPGQPLKDARP